MTEDYVAPEVTEMVIRSNEAKLSIGNLRKAKEAREAVEAVPAVKAITDEDGNEVSAAQEAIKGVEAREATTQDQAVWLHAKTEAIMDEVIARMADQGFHVNDSDAPVETDYGFKVVYHAETDKPIRAAFKKVKGKDDYNKPGLETLKEEEKARKAEERDAAKKAADEAKAQVDAEKDMEADDEDPEGFDE